MSDHEIDKLRMAITAALGEATGIANVPGEKFVEALAKRVTVKSEPPPKKVWRVSLDLGYKLYEAVKTHTLATEIDAKYAADIIRERPDLVAAEWERRHRAIGYTDDLNVGIWRRRLFPELDP